LAQYKITRYYLPLKRAGSAFRNQTSRLSGAEQSPTSWTFGKYGSFNVEFAVSCLSLSWFKKFHLLFKTSVFREKKSMATDVLVYLALSLHVAVKWYYMFFSYKHFQNSLYKGYDLQEKVLRKLQKHLLSISEINKFAVTLTDIHVFR